MDVAEAKERRGRGRPRKGELVTNKMKNLHLTISPEGAELISQLAQRLGMSQGAVIEHATRLLAKAA